MNAGFFVVTIVAVIAAAAELAPSVRTRAVSPRTVAFIAVGLLVLAAVVAVAAAIGGDETALARDASL